MDSIRIAMTEEQFKKAIHVAWLGGFGAKFADPMIRAYLLGRGALTGKQADLLNDLYAERKDRTCKAERCGYCQPEAYAAEAEQVEAMRRKFAR